VTTVPYRIYCVCVSWYCSAVGKRVRVEGECMYWYLSRTSQQQLWHSTNGCRLVSQSVDTSNSTIYPHHPGDSIILFCGCWFRGRSIFFTFSWCPFFLCLSLFLTHYLVWYRGRCSLSLCNPFLSLFFFSQKKRRQTILTTQEKEREATKEKNNTTLYYTVYFRVGSI